MPITFVINQEEEENPPQVVIKVGEQKKPQATVLLNARKSLDGNIMIFDHVDIDIVLVPKTKKIVTFSKGRKVTSDKVYKTQNRLFEFLAKKGLIAHSTIQGGNVYGSLEAQLLESIDEKIDPFHVALFLIESFMKKERPYFADEVDEEEEYLLNPTDEDSTELGEVPQEEKKGSLVPGWVRGPYGMTTFYRY
jgi:hypothetical protein